MSPRSNPFTTFFTFALAISAPAKVLLLRQPRAHCLFQFSHSRNSDDGNKMTTVELLMIESVSVAM